MSDGLDVVLVGLGKDLADATAQASEQLEASRSTSRRLDQLEQRVAEELVEGSDLPLRGPPSDLPTRQAASPPAKAEAAAGLSWGALRDEAEGHLLARGVDPRSVTLDALLDAREVERIEARFGGEFSLRARLDSYDVVAAIAAGLAAALVDFLVVRTPKDLVGGTSYLGQYQQAGSPVTKFLRSKALPHDNPLSHWCKVPYDSVSAKAVGREIPGMGPRSHRAMTVGHDPLLGLVFGTLDILKGRMTAIDKYGTVHVVGGLPRPTNDPVVALALQIAHLLSDAPTKLGLPPPGWSALQTLTVGSFGERERRVADLARYMYLQGYDSWHFLTMATSVASAEAILRAYYALRRWADRDYAETVEHEASVARVDRTSGHPRYQALAFTAHTIATAANAGKIAVYHGNPLAINYAQWIRFLRAAQRYAAGQWRSPSDVVIGHARANLEALQRGWPQLDAEGPAFPVLRA